MPRDDLGEALKLLRYVRGWEQRQLARAAKVRGHWVGEYESGDRRPEPEELRRLVAAMGFAPDAVERTHRFLAGLREIGPPEAPEERAAADASLERELEQFEAEMAAAVSRLSRTIRQLARRDG
jgi:transcriptional regulator with XRE-family HTH domain